ncbi:hypothetical protein MASR2M78_18070 [Treponema sp.]
MASPQIEKPILELKDVSFNNNQVNIINHIDLKIQRGEIIAIAGDRGSGKSTLRNILALHQGPSSGCVEWKGMPVSKYSFRINKPRIQMVHQDDALISYFTVAENMFLPEQIFRPFPFIDRKRMIASAGEFIEQHGFSIDPKRIFTSLTMSERVVLEFLRCIFREPDVLILDESLSKLSGKDLDQVVYLLKEQAAKGMAIICISHRIDDIYNLAQKVAVIREGRILLTTETRKIDRLNLIKLCYTQVTRNKASEDINREFYQLLRYNEAILRNLPISLVVTDDLDNIKMINDLGQTFFQVQQHQYINKPISSLIPNEDVLHQILQGFNKKKESAFFGQFINDIIVNIKIFPIFDGTFPIGNITIIEDVTEQEKLRQRINLSENLASLGLLAAGVAHEINNPLEIIYNYLSFMRMNPDRNQLLQTVKNLEEEIDGIKHIVSTLVSFSGNKQQNAEHFDANILISETLTLLRPAAKQRGIECHFSPRADELSLFANKTEIRQVILNLIKNCFEVLTEGGNVDIQASLERDRILIIISDDGPGINAEDSEQVFLPFYSTKKNSPNNMGLGLTMSYGIVKKHNGQLSFSNKEDGGCEFTIALPL